MSNSVVFLLVAVALSAVGTLVVWLHGRPRRPRSSVDSFNRGLRALSQDASRYEAPSGVVLRTADNAVAEPDELADTEVAEPAGPEAPTARAPRPSPRPSPRPQGGRSDREGTRPGS